MNAQDYDETLPLNDYLGSGLGPLTGWRDPLTVPLRFQPQPG